jgi:hypothetical protein
VSSRADFFVAIPEYQAFQHCRAVSDYQYAEQLVHKRLTDQNALKVDANGLTRFQPHLNLTANVGRGGSRAKHENLGIGAGGNCHRTSR